MKMIDNVLAALVRRPCLHDPLSIALAGLAEGTLRLLPGAAARRQALLLRLHEAAQRPHASGRLGDDLLRTGAAPEAEERLLLTA